MFKCINVCAKLINIKLKLKLEKHFCCCSLSFLSALRVQFSMSHLIEFLLLLLLLLLLFFLIVFVFLIVVVARKHVPSL